MKNVQSFGINTLLRIRSLLKLDAESCTGTSMRRSSATLVANGGGDITTIKSQCWFCDMKCLISDLRGESANSLDSLKRDWPQ
jgi:hypothetical protein